MILGIPPFDDDDIHFLSEVDYLIRGVVGVNSPPRFMVFRIDNWFGDKWLRFSGKTLGALGVWRDTFTTVPPFVQNRITAQSLLEQTNGYRYKYVGAGDNIHNDGPSWHNFGNRAATTAPDTALFWFSGNSKANARGSLMGYTPLSDRYWQWYLEFEASNPWKVSKRVDFHESDLELAHSRMVTLIGT